MPELLEANQVGKLQDISDAVFNVEAAETPFISMCGKDPKPHQKQSSWQSEKYPVDGHQGEMDGQDVTNFDSGQRKLLYGMAQLLRRAYKVSTFADVTDVAGIKREIAHQKALAMVVLKTKMESRALSDSESSEDDNVAIPNETRGGFKWLDTGAQAHLPVDPLFRPPVECHHTTPLDTFTEKTFRSQLDAAYKLRRSKSSLDGFVGVTLKGLVDDWTVYDSQTPTQVPVRSFQHKGDSGQLINVVDFLKFSTGTVRLHISSQLHTDEATGAPTNFTDRSGLFLDMRMWRIAFMKRPQDRRLQDGGGGPRGYCETIMMLKCMNPLGHLKVETDLDS